MTADHTTQPTTTVPTPVRQAAYDAIYGLIRALGDHMPVSPVHRNALIWRAVETALDAMDGQGRLLPAPTEVRIEFGAWCHAENRDGIRLSQDQFASRERAAEWGDERIGRYGIEGYRVMRREHHVFAEGSRFATAITAWTEDSEERR